MMHGAPNRIVHDKAIGEWRMIMRAQATHREIVLSAPHQNGVFAADAPLDDCPVCERLDSNAGLKIRGISLFHVCVSRDDPPLFGAHAYWRLKPVTDPSVVEAPVDAEW
jgi:hypothetical protein